MRFRIEDYELVETFQPIKRTAQKTRRLDRSRTAAAKATTIARKRQRSVKGVV